MTANVKALAEISSRIKTLEKNTVSNAVEIGHLLHEAREQIPHGEYKAWLLQQFGWSYRTSLRFHHAYSFSGKCQIGTFEKLDLSLSALHLVADPYTDEVARNAIIKAASNGRVTYKIAKAIIAEHAPAKPLDEPLPIDPIDDELASDESSPIDGDGETGDQPSAATALRIVSRISEQDTAWPKIIAAIGGLVKLLEITETLQAVYNRHCDKDAVKSKADRAEAKSSRTMHH
jgi:hypothetical protein